VCDRVPNAFGITTLNRIGQSQAKGERSVTRSLRRFFARQFPRTPYLGSWTEGGTCPITPLHAPVAQHSESVTSQMGTSGAMSLRSAPAERAWERNAELASHLRRWSFLQPKRVNAAASWGFFSSKRGLHRTSYRIWTPWVTISTNLRRV
jgi:hypothetical protein